MKKLYEKNELRFALLWIFAYCIVSIPIRGALKSVGRFAMSYSGMAQVFAAASML